jgi:hypothetical protein
MRKPPLTRISHTEVRHRFAEVKSRFTVLTSAIGINAAATIAILGVLVRH